jgi:type IV secretory pathway protease TraF
VLAGVLAGATAAAWWRWRPFGVEVEGTSMRPSLEPGDWAIAVSTARIRPGDVVLIEHPERPGFEMVKRVAAGPGGPAPDGREMGTGWLWVQGDASERSTDSRAFGPIRIQDVRGRVVLVWWPPSRWRRQ